MSESALWSRSHDSSGRPAGDRHSPALAAMAFLLLYVLPSLFGWWLILVCLRSVAGAFAGLMS